MSYFFQSEHEAYHNRPAPTGLPPAFARLHSLHNTLSPRIRNHNLDLHARWQKTATVSHESACSREQDESVAVLTYFRSQQAAEKIEQMMGISPNSPVDTHRHPVIEIRLAADHVAVELIVSPYAWWDQQNFIGKLELPNHRAALRSLLRNLPSDYCFGFWGGLCLTDMHLTIGQLLRGRVMDEWLKTFADGQDWLRLGCWYDLNSVSLEDPAFVAEIFNTIKNLNGLYHFLLWTSNNNYHKFYEKRQTQPRRIYA